MTVYIITPANFTSGGPELLHQLAFVRGFMGIPAKIVYYSRETEEFVRADTPEQYNKYNIIVEENFDAINSEENVAVIPETALFTLGRIEKCRKIMWWLSVDGYVMSMLYLNGNTDYSTGYTKELDYYNIAGRDDIFHMVQSEYARDFVINKMGVSHENVEYLSDYINDLYLQPLDVSPEKRKNIALYNPKKGYEEILPIIKKSGNEIIWLPIYNMTPLKVRAYMSIAKVYVDFGHHPGKDRIPREAAISGCCVITNKKGAAAYYKDVPILEKYKFENVSESTDEIISLIRCIFDDYMSYSMDFDGYRNIIMSEKEKFVEDALRIFKNKKW